MQRWCNAEQQVGRLCLRWRNRNLIGVPVKYSLDKIRVPRGEFTLLWNTNYEIINQRQKKRVTYSAWPSRSRSAEERRLLTGLLFFRPLITFIVRGGKIVYSDIISSSTKGISMPIKDSITCPVQTDDSLSYLPVNLQGISNSLRSIPQWVHWKLKTVDGKKSKPPTCANGYRTDIHNPDSWLTFQQATDSYNPKIHHGISFVLDNSGYTGIDIDNCLEINGDASSLKSWVG